jgi:RAMA domain-containing protein
MPSPVIPVNVQIPSQPTAPLIADFVEHALRVAYVNKRDVERLQEAEWGVPGVYVLLTDDEHGTAYVGKATGLRDRLLQHRRTPKIPWRRALLIKRDTSHGFNSAEIGYLEGRLSAELDAVDRLSVSKGKTDQDATLPVHMQISLDALLTSMMAAVRLAGVDINKEGDDPEGAPTKGGTKTSIPGTVADLLAAGLLQAGAECYFPRSGRTARSTVTAAGELIVNGVAYASPSKAGAVALGLKATNGWDSWHVGSPTGPKLADLRAQLPRPTGE